MIQVKEIADCNVPSVLAQANVSWRDKIAVVRFINCSPFCWVGFVDGQFACMWGLIPPTLLSNNAYLWLITNELIDEHKFVFVRHSQKEIAKMLDMFPVIKGHCMRSHLRSMQWLRWLGAKFDSGLGLAAEFTITRDEDG